MKKKIVIISVSLTIIIWGILTFGKATNSFQGLDLFILILIIVLGLIALLSITRKNKESKQGLAVEDELSNLIKYKAGYQAYMSSMYMWLFIFLLKDKFPNIESMLGGGILLSALIFFITKYNTRKNFND